MIKNASLVLIAVVCLLSGCAIVVPYNQTPAELRDDPAKLREQISYQMTFEEFLQAAYVTQTSCGDSVTFIVSPDRASATAMLSIPGLSSTATIALAEAKPDTNGTVVKVWAQNNGWTTAYLRALRQISSPPRCHG